MAVCFWWYKVVLLRHCPLGEGRAASMEGHVRPGEGPRPTSCLGCTKDSEQNPACPDQLRPKAKVCKFPQGLFINFSIRGHT